jgi:arylsulfatase A-like enzyme
MSDKRFIALAFIPCAALALALAACSHEPSESTPWNVLLITLDTTRADALGCYGAKADATPVLDAIAAEGTRFDQAIASAALTPVSHASILTGLEPREHGVRVLAGRGGYRLHDDVPTLATILHARGYHTAACLSALTVSRWFGFERGFDVFDGFDGAFEPGTLGNLTWDQSNLQRRSDATTDLAIAQTRGKEPFFLWVHYWDPHDEALVPPPEFLRPGLPRDAQGHLQPCRALYADEVHYMDHEIGRLVDALKSSGQWDHTLVVVVADHGEGLGDHGWATHRILYQEEIRVPLIVRVPGAKPAHEVKALVRTIDIAPTVLDYLHDDAPRAMSGTSLRALIEGRADVPRVAFAEALNGYDLNVQSLAARPQDDFVYAAIDWPWKLVYRPLHPHQHELFDLSLDPHEMQNRFATEPAQVMRLEQLLAQHAAWVAAPFPPIETSGVSAEHAHRMFAELGYVAGSMPGTDARFGFACPREPADVHDTADECVHCGGRPLLIARPH